MIRTKFNPDDYFNFRHEYPKKIFDPIRNYLKQDSSLLDLGSGTGFVASSILRDFSLGLLTLVEPDLELLNTAKKVLATKSAIAKIDFIHSRAESIAIPNQSVDLVLVGSAWHWMDPNQTKNEITRILKPGGVVYIFEYQFPKGVPLHSELNEWIRRQFNLFWRAPNQTPRGSLKEITEVFRKPGGAAHFAERTGAKFSESVPLSPQFLAGFIFSQSRFQHYLETLPECDRPIYKKQVFEKLTELYDGRDTIQFVYPYEGFVFQAE